MIYILWNVNCYEATNKLDNISVKLTPRVPSLSPSDSPLVLLLLPLTPSNAVENKSAPIMILENETILNRLVFFYFYNTKILEGISMK